MSESINTIVSKLHEEFPQAEISLIGDDLSIRFYDTHISTAVINKVEEILFMRGKLTTNCKERIFVKNATIHVNVKFWGIFYRVYCKLIEMKADVKAADIDEDISFIMSKEYLSYSQLEAIQEIINEEMGVHVTEHDDIRVFGHPSDVVMNLRLKKYSE